jgi:hypothetical protein
MQIITNYTIASATEHTLADWDQYVQKHPHATPYHSFAWINSVNNAYEHNNVSLIAYESQKVVGLCHA